MNRKLVTVLSFLLVMMSSGFLWADLTIRASIDQNEITPEEDVTLSVMVEGDLNSGEPVAPSVPGLAIHKSGRTSQIQIINGQMTITAEFLYTVVPDQEGVYNIPPFQVLQGGRTFKSNPITLKVTSAAAVNRNQNQNQMGGQQAYSNQGSNSGADPHFWIETPISIPNPFVSQQVMYHFKLYTRENITQAAPLLPEFNDFLAETVVEDKRGNEVVNGKSYATWEKIIALTPLKPGQVTIPSAEIEIVYEVIENSRPLNRWDPFLNNSLFNNAFRQTKRARLKSKPVTLDIRSLPEPVPANFTGLVGQFGLQTSLSEANIKVGDSTTLEITLSGAGNINDAKLPEMKIDGFKTYFDKPQSDVLKSEMGLSGQKIFKIALVPQNEGKFKLPPIRVSYYDPNEMRYVDLEADVPELAVAPTADDQGTSVVLANSTGAQQVMYEDLAPIFPDARRVFSSTTFKLPLPVFYSVVFGLPVSFLILVLARNIKSPKSTRAKAARNRAFKGLLQVLESASSDETQVLHAVRDYMTATFQVQGQSLTAKDMMEICRRHQVPDKIIQRLGQTIENLESVQYGFDKKSALGAVTKELKQVMHDIHKAA